MEGSGLRKLWELYRHSPGGTEENQEYLKSCCYKLLF
jgi:hypothetical protein